MIDKQKSQLHRYVERLERLEEHKKEIAAEIALLYKDVKEAGFQVKAVRFIVRLRVSGAKLRDDVFHAIDMYAVALGMV